MWHIRSKSRWESPIEFSHERHSILSPLLIDLFCDWTVQAELSIVVIRLRQRNLVSNNVPLSLSFFTHLHFTHYLFSSLLLITGLPTGCQLDPTFSIGLSSGYTAVPLFPLYSRVSRYHICIYTLYYACIILHIPDILVCFQEKHFFPIHSSFLSNRRSMKKMRPQNHISKFSLALFPSSVCVCVYLTSLRMNAFPVSLFADDYL